MQKLSKLTQQVRKWNMMGQSLLPELELIIIANKINQPHAEAIIQDFEGIEMNVSPDKTEDVSHYRLFLLKSNVYGRVHLLLGLEEAVIKDHEFRERKQMI